MEDGLKIEISFTKKKHLKYHGADVAGTVMCLGSLTVHVCCWVKYLPLPLYDVSFSQYRHFPKNVSFPLAKRPSLDGVVSSKLDAFASVMPAFENH